MKKIIACIVLTVSIMITLFTTKAFFNTSDRLRNIFHTTKYSININPNGGTISKNSILLKDGKISLPVSYKRGYDFIGYGTNDSSVIKAEDKLDISKINNQTLLANWNIINYSINYNLNGGSILNHLSTYNVEDTFTLPTPTKEGAVFVGWTGSGLDTPTTNVVVSNSTGNKEYIANWNMNTYTLDVNSIVQNIEYGEGLEGFEFSVWINDNLIANHVKDYYNNSVEFGSTVRVYVYDRDGYNITSFRDQTWTITAPLTINPTWYDNIPPTITSFNVENLGFYDPSKGPGAGWNIKIYIDAYDNGTGLQKFQTWLKPYLNASGTARKDGQERFLENVLYLNTAQGRTFCAYAIDNAGNEAERCETLYT